MQAKLLATAEWSSTDAGRLTQAQVPTTTAAGTPTIIGTKLEQRRDMTNRNMIVSKQ